MKYIDSILKFAESDKKDFSILDKLIAEGLCKKIIMSVVDFKTWYTGNFEHLSTPVNKKDLVEAIKNPISYERIEEFSSTMLSLVDLKEFFAEILNDNAYVGFDPQTMVTILEKCYGGSSDINEDANCFYAEMAFLIMLFLQRGTSVVDSKKMGTLQTEAKKRVAFLKNKYHIASKIGNSDKKMVVTLSRIAACFPLVTCAVMFTSKVPRPVSEDTMKSRYVDFPRHLRNSCWFSIIYPKGKNSGIVKALLHYQVLEGIVINQKNKEYKEMTLESKMEEAIKYGSAAFRSPLIKDADRKKAVSKYLRIPVETQKKWEEIFDREFPGAIANVKNFFDQADYDD